MKRMSAAEWGLLLTLAVLWGGTFLFQKVALADLPPFTILVVRVALAAVALGVAVSIAGHRLPAPRWPSPSWPRSTTSSPSA